MPELPDVVVYIEAPARRVVGRRLERVRLSRLLHDDWPKSIEELEGVTR